MRLALLALVCLAGCHQVRPGPGPAPVTDAELGVLCACQHAEVMSPAEASACTDCVWARHAATVARADLRLCRSVSQADLGEMARVVQATTVERDVARGEAEDLRSERWWWGLGGTVLGALVAGLLAGLL